MKKAIFWLIMPILIFFIASLNAQALTMQEILQGYDNYSNGQVLGTSTQPALNARYNFNFDTVIDQNDLTILLRVVGGISSCPSNVNCDLNGDNKLSTTDLITLKNYIISLYDYNGNGAITIADLNYLTDVMNNTRACPTGRLCDINHDSAINNSDLDIIKAVIMSGSFSTIPVSDISVTSPAGGEQWAAGSTHTITWTAPSTVTNVNISVQQAVSPCNTSTLICLNRYPATTVIASNVPNTGSYIWTIGSSIGTGQFNLTVADAGTSGLSGTSASAFNVVSATGTNNPPKINGFSVMLANIQPGQTVNFSWNATDPDNDNLSWSVVWSDNSGGSGACQVNAPRNGANWNFSTSHAWMNAGTYTVTATVSDCKGGSDSNSFNVNVGSSTQPSITALSPNGGETYKVGDTVKIRWYSANVPAGAGVNFQLSYRLNGVMYEDVLTNAEGREFGQVNNNGVLDWIIPSGYGRTGFDPNAFRIRVILSGPGISGTNPPQDYSDAPFSIVSATTTGSVSVSPASLNFTSTAATQEGEGNSKPFSQMLYVSNPNNASWSASILSGSQWLSTDLTNLSGLNSLGNSGSMEVFANPANLSAGTYQGTISIFGNFSGSPITVPVTLTVLTPPTTPITQPALNARYNFNFDTVIDQNDLTILLRVVGGISSCPSNVNCDLNGDNKLSTTDLITLKNYIISLYDYNGNGAITIADFNYLTDVMNNTRACPTGRLCDINHDSAINNSDLDILKAVIMSGSFPTVPVLEQPQGTVLPYAVKDGDIVIFRGNPTVYLIKPDGLYPFDSYESYKTYIRTFRKKLRLFRGQASTYTLNDSPAGTQFALP